MRSPLLAAGLMASVCAVSLAADVQEFPIFVGPGHQARPKVGGDIVVWTDYPANNSDIRGKRISTGQEFTVCDNPADQDKPTISGSIVTWQDSRDMPPFRGYAKDLQSGQEFRVTNFDSDQEQPFVSGNLFVWTDNRNGGSEVYGRYLGSPDDFPVAVGPPGTSRVAVASGDVVVWTETPFGSSTGSIYGKRLSTGQEYTVCVNAPKVANPSISGDIVVWQDKRNGDYGVYGKDLATGAEFTVATTGASPVVSGNYVVWVAPSNSRDILGKNLLTGETFPICTNAAEQCEPFIDGNLVVWVDYRNGSTGDIYGAYVPEPATLALLALGALPMIRRRRSCIGLVEPPYGR